jgi:hypothetical protein
MATDEVRTYVTLQTSAKNLRPATRASTGVVHPGCLSLASAARAETFALGILRRHCSAYAGVAPVETILRARPDTTVANVFQMINELTLRIELVSQRAPSQRAPVARRSLPLPQFTLRGADHERAPTPPSHAIFERLFAREHRIETLPKRDLAPTPSPTHTGDRATAPEAPVPTGWSSGEMVLRREVVRERAAPPSRTLRDSASTTVRGPSGSDAVRTIPFAQAATPFSASELGRLTDEVVRTIDRRIIAQRERKGVI